MEIPISSTNTNAWNQFGLSVSLLLSPIMEVKKKTNVGDYAHLPGSLCFSEP